MQDCWSGIYYFIKGSAYACLNMDIMMMSCYEKSVNFLRNTGWIEELSGFYYNIGATYISLKKYEEAISCLENTGSTMLSAIVLICGFLPDVLLSVFVAAWILIVKPSEENRKVYEAVRK